jgi:hypothetical protein
MSSGTCTKCGLVVSSGEAWCRGCGARLSLVAEPGGGATGQTVPIHNGAATHSAVPDYGLPGGSSYGPGFSQEGGGIWRDGKTLVMQKTARLPDYCIKCGVPANGAHLRKKMSWHHPALALLVLAGILIYLIVALVVRKSATIDISLCEDHLRKHRTAVIVSWLIFLAGVAFMALAIAKESGGSALFGLLLLFASAISAATWAKVVTVKKIDDYFVWLRGSDESFFAMLPSVNKR